ncbi:helix-turn-helix DNA binding domain protein [Mycobacterium phage Gravaillia]|uniref:Helix-turn-helix DNA binding domain protein n=1 Tax=Mycobacterium phage OBUpride TaxID=1698367 RepID=A0A0K2CMD0_9CAUD|nr:hypothetical protein SEA_OBUpride_53 [Mycobacterium phage OBUpride]WAB10161.1 helix-turn-helix DNA binding domain protein [Mycobacterium phage Gravaillia]
MSEHTQRRGCTKCGATPVRGRGMCSYHYEKMRRYLHSVGAFESMLVPVGPVRDHVRALRAAGMGVHRIGALSGVQPRTVWALTDPARRYTERHVAAAILEVDVPSSHRLDPALADGLRVSIIPTQRRARALAVIGYDQPSLLAALGLPSTGRGVSKLYTAHRPHVTAKRHREIEALFNELVWTPGPSAEATKRAVAKGWWGPWAWDDIDDLDCVPDAVPSRMERRRAAARVARKQWLEDTLADHIAVGRVDPNDNAAVAAVLGITRQAVEQRRLRASKCVDAEAVAS